MIKPEKPWLTLRSWIEVVRRARLGRTTKAVALMMATYADSDGTRVFPGVARLAVDCELTYNVVQTSLRKLRAAGLIEVVRQASRRGYADEYRLILADDLPDRLEVLDPGQVSAAAAALAGRRRGRYRPAAGAAGGDVAGDVPRDGVLHATAAGAGGVDHAGLRTTPCGAGAGTAAGPAPHGVDGLVAAAPHPDVHLHPAAMPPTVHGPLHQLSVASEYWLWHEVGECLVPGLVGEDDAAPEEVEVGAAEHGAFDGFESADVALDGAAVPVEGQAVADGFVVFDESGGEAGERGDAAVLCVADPGVEVLALAVAEHAGEVADEPVDGVQAGAALQDAGELGLVVFGALGGRLDDPSGDLPRFERCRRDRCGRDSADAPGLQEPADAALAAVVAVIA
nr:helix-turn-helix domain-containing protein [Dactylosporangium matsuzakiense]